MQLKVGWFYVLKDTWCGWKLSSIVYSSHVLTLHICAVSFTVITRGSKNFPEIYKPPPNFGRHMGDIKPVRYCGPTIWSDLWFMLFGAFCSTIGNLTHFFVCKGKNCSNFAQTIWRQRTKFSRPHLSTANSLFLPPNHLTRLRNNALPIERALSLPDWVCTSVEWPKLHFYNLIPQKVVHTSFSVKLPIL